MQIVTPQFLVEESLYYLFLHPSSPYFGTVELTRFFTIFSVCACLYLAGNRLRQHEKGRENEGQPGKQQDPKSKTLGEGLPWQRGPLWGRFLRPMGRGNESGNVETKGNTREAHKESALLEIKSLMKCN